jgi:CheY-like chemotaxis protein
LIRRLLQAHKNYRVFESNNPLDGIELVKQRQPGLVITDLTMPGIDGFSLLERLKSDPATAKIPVIILSGKMLTAADERRLKGQPESVWQKGNFNTRELVDHVVSTLNDTVPIDTRIEIKGQAPAIPAPETMPTALSAVPVKAAKTDTSTQPAVVIPTKPGSVLVIDDNARDSRLVRRILEAEKRYRVIEAASGADGLAAMRQSPPDLVLLDLLLPDMSGLDVIDQIRATPELRDIPIIMLTGKDLSTVERERLGDVTIWHKGNLDRRRLLQSVEEAIL